MATQTPFKVETLATQALNPVGAPKPEDEVEHLLRQLDLSQTQVATLLGLSPQAVSKGFKEDGVQYLGGGGRAIRLHQALNYIGGDRYALSALRLRDVGRNLGWGAFESETVDLVPAQEVYSSAEEIWVVSDSPSSVLDWEALRSHLFESPNRERHKVVVFFLRTLEAAERWAEVLEREFARPAIHDGHLNLDQTASAGAYIVLVVTNALAYSQDFLVTDAGSRCVDVMGSTKSPTIYQWAGSAYIRSKNQNTGFARLARTLELGTSTIKANFFPRGIPLKSDVLDFKHTFIDGLIAIRGETLEEDASPTGERMGGGILANSAVTRPANTIGFNKKSKFTPVFLLVYRRRPNEGLNRNKPLRLLLDELERAREQAPDAEPKTTPPNSFW